MKIEDFKVGKFFLAPMEFFTENSAREIKQQIETFAFVTDDGMVMCMVEEDTTSVLRRESRFVFSVKPKDNYMPITRAVVHKEGRDFSRFKALSDKEEAEYGVLWALLGYYQPEFRTQK